MRRFSRRPNGAASTTKPFLSSNVHQVNAAVAKISSLRIEIVKRSVAAVREAPALVNFIISKDCPVSASLTDGDKAQLLKIKQDADKNFPPPAASKNDK